MSEASAWDIGFDRLIIAAAASEGCTIVTSDDKFLLYDVPVIDARR